MTDPYDRLSDDAAEEASLLGNGVRPRDLLRREREEARVTAVLAERAAAAAADDEAADDEAAE